VAVAHDTETRFPATDGPSGVNSVDTTTGDRTFTHSGAAGAKGACVMLFCTGTTTTVTGVLYGGVAMTLATAKVDTTEAGRVEAWTLTGASFPSGSQTVTLQGCTATAKWVCCSSVTADVGVIVEDQQGKDTTTSANPQVTMATTRLTMAYAGIHSGTAAPATSAFTGVTYQKRNDYGALSANAVRRTSPTAAGSYTIGCTLGSDDHCVCAVAFAESEFAAFPSTPILDPFSYSDGDLETVSSGTWLHDPANIDFDNSAVASGQVTVTSGVGAAWFNTTFRPSQEAYFDIPQASAYMGVYLRVEQPSTSSSTMDGYQVEVEDTTLAIYKFSDTSGALIGATQTVTALADGDALGGRVVGQTIQAYRRSGGVWAPYGLPRVGWGTPAAASYLGFIMEDTGVEPIIDNYGGGNAAFHANRSRLAVQRAQPPPRAGAFV
jgi:hypothetical protein